MMNYKLTAVRTVLPMIMVALFSYTAKSQTITKAASIAYTNGVPIHTPSSAGSEVAINTVNKDFYFWNGTAWVKVVYGAGGNVAYQNQVNTFTQNQILNLPNVTGSSTTNSIDISQTWNTTGVSHLIRANLVTATSGFGSSFLRFNVASTPVFQVTTNGTIVLGTAATGGGISSANPASGAFLADGRAVAAYHNLTTHAGYGVWAARSSGNRVATSGETGLFAVGETFAPTSGTATYNTSLIRPTINQTGGANGITRGLWIDPILTAAVDFRSIEVTNGRVMFNQPSLVSTPAQQFTGAWFTGGTSTTTKPHVLIEPAGVTSTAWNTAGTGLGVNAASGFTGNLLDLQLNGASRVSVASTGTIITSGQVNAASLVTSNTSIGANTAFYISGKSKLRSNVDGTFEMFNNGETNFDRLSFGGTTSLFPALQTASSNAQTGLAATFVNGSSTITTATNAYAVNQVVQFTTTGTLPTGFAINTNYFIVGTPTSTTIEVSATSGGSAITAGSAGSGTHTVVRQNTCIFTNGSSTVTTASAHTLRVGDVIRFSNAGGSLPSSISTSVDYYILSTTSTTFTFGTFFGGTAITPPETGVTATFSGTPNITTGTQTYVAGSVVRFTTTGTLPTGLATGTDYYVIATSLSTTNIQVSATLGGTAIAYTGTGSGVHTVTRQILGNGIQFFTRNPGIYVRTADNLATSALYAGNIVAAAPTGYTGRILDLRVGTSTMLNVDQVGNLVIGGNLTAGIVTAGTYFSTPIIYAGGGGTTSFGNHVLMGTGGGGTITTSATAEVRSTTAGFLPPRMTTTQKNAIATPATGLMVYDTTLNKLCVYTGSAWETISSL